MCLTKDFQDNSAVLQQDETMLQPKQGREGNSKEINQHTEK
jgi:hypothetical protein